MKTGAWTPCPSCFYQPRGAEELAKSLMVSDQCIAVQLLGEFAVRRQRGESFQFDQELVELFKQRVAIVIPLTPDGKPGQIEDVSPPTATVPASPVGEGPSHKPWWRFWS